VEKFLQEISRQESRAIEPRDAAAVRFGLMFHIQYKFKSRPCSESQASERQMYWRKKQNLT